MTECLILSQVDAKCLTLMGCSVLTVIQKTGRLGTAPE